MPKMNIISKTINKEISLKLSVIINVFYVKIRFGLGKIRNSSWKLEIFIDSNGFSAFRTGIRIPKENGD